MSHYETLEVSRNASPEVIRAAYKSLIQRYHPDKNPNQEQAATKAQQVTEAYTVLSDPEKRAAYDAKFFSQDQFFSNGSNVQPTTAVVDLSVPPTTRRQSTDPSIKVVEINGNLSKPAIAIVILVISVIGFFAWSADKKQKEFDLAWAAITEKSNIERAEKERKNLELQKKKAEDDEALDLSRRTLAPFPNNISVNLIEAKSYPVRFTGKILTIPQISLVVGKIDSELVVANVQQNRGVLAQNVFEQLSKLDERSLMTVDADAHIRNIIKDNMNKIVLGENYKQENLCVVAFPSSSSSRYESKCRGIESVKLPQSFVFR